MAEKRRNSGVERVLLLTGSTAAELSGQLEAPDAELLNRDDASGPPAGGPCRLAVVAPTARRLALIRRIVGQGTPWRGRNDIWFTTTPLHPKPAPNRLAFVFPGLEEEFEPRVDDVAEHFGLDRPELSGSAANDKAPLARHGLGVFAVGRLLDAALRELGLVPDLVAGHSVGEWNAMVSAGIHPSRAVEEFITSFDPATLRVPGVAFAALGCSAQQAMDAIGGLNGVVVSHDNCPHQSIICGEVYTVAAVLDRLRESGITGQVLSFQSGFHSPMLKPYLSRILETFGSVPVQPALHPIWSATTVDRYPTDPAVIRDLITRHLLEPVRFGPLVRRLYELGTRAFVQVGTGSLPAFVADTLAGLPHLAVSANVPSRPGLDQLRRVLAALWVEGWAPQLDRLPPAPSPSIHSVSSPQPAELPAAEHPVLVELDAVLRDAAAAAKDIVHSWAKTTRSHASTTRDLSLATMPYLADHCFYRQPEGWPEPADRYPVVPFTTMLELMVDAARALSPGRVVVGLQNVRALRWLAVAPPVTLTTSASVGSDGNVCVALEGYARGTVLLADGYPAPPDEPDRPLRGERSCEVTAAALYGDRWMFHGPQFQGVVELGSIGDNGIRGVLAVPPVPGALLDNAGQLLGFWIMRQLPANRLAYPTALERVRWYGPQPPAGERMSCTARVVSVTDTEVVADHDLRRADGRLWVRIDRWRGRRFDTDEVTWPVHLFPEHNRIAQRQPGGWYLVRDPWPDPATRELFMRRYLNAAEREDYQGQTPRAGQQWLLGRVAVKDAVRQWLWDAGAGPVFPIEVTVSNNDSGRPRVAGPFDQPPEVSLAHTGPLAAALVCSPDRCPTGVGIDIEQVTYRDEKAVAAILTGAERRLLDARHSSAAERASWVTRFLTAKEAVAKATRTGLGGRAHQFAVEQIDGDRLLVAAGGGTPRRWVQTAVGDEPEPYAVAWTPPGNAGRADEHAAAHAEGTPG